MKEIIRRLVEALEQYAPRDRAVTQDLIAEARKPLEGDALAQPASEDAWLKEANERFAVCERRLIAMADDDLPDADFMAAPDRYQEAKNALRDHLRTRSAREGFVSVNEQTIRAAAEVMEKEFANLGNFSCTKEVWADKIRGWLFIREPVERSLRKAMIAAAKGDGK